MKTDVTQIFVRSWLILSEVPGWPDAPVSLRLRRIAPILVAVTAMVGLLGWKYGWREPEQRAIRAQYAPVMAFEEEVALLRLACSDQQAVEIAAQAEAARSLLLASPEDVPTFLREMRTRIGALGWDAAFQAYDPGLAVIETVDGVEFSSARGRLAPINGNPAPFSTLLGVFNQISSGNKRIDLTRLGVRADENGTLEVEFNLRIACHSEDEKAS